MRKGLMVCFVLSKLSAHMHNPSVTYISIYTLFGEITVRN